MNQFNIEELYEIRDAVFCTAKSLEIYNKVQSMIDNYHAGLPNDVINTLSWPALRYTYGRKTHIVDTVCRSLITVKNRIRNDIKKLMIKETQIELEKDNSLDNCHVNAYINLISELEDTLRKD